MDPVVAYLESIQFWHWWILGLVLLVFELVVLGTYFLLWLAAAAGGVGLLLLAAPGTSWQIQLLVFAVLSVGAVVGWRYWQHQNPPQHDENTLNQRGAQYVGRMASLDDATENGVGKVRIDDTFWKVATSDGSDLAAGTQVKITGADGIVLKVESA